jgi:hypothetical protein
MDNFFPKAQGQRRCTTNVSDSQKDVSMPGFSGIAIEEGIKKMHILHRRILLFTNFLIGHFP